MAAVHSRNKVTAGSAQWILEERKAGTQFVKEETDEFAFAVRNELEWLNEHMAEVFNRTEFDVVEAFKTPGKLRGKTPRTVRKQNVPGSRAPLTDIFASNVQPPASPRLPKSSKPVARFQVAEDEIIQPEEIGPSIHVYEGTGKENTDSGYHEMTDEGTPIATGTPTTPTSAAQDALDRKQIFRVSEAQPDRSPSSQQDEVVETQEEQQHNVIETQHHSLSMQATPNVESEREHLHLASSNAEDLPSTTEKFPPIELPISLNLEVSGNSTEHERDQTLQLAVPLEQELGSSPSDQSTPARPLLRKKSSLTFASLPAREPLTSKKSVGPSMMRTSQLGVSRPHPGPVDNIFTGSVGMKERSEYHAREHDRTSMEVLEHAQDTQPGEEIAAPAGLISESKSIEEALKAQSRASTLRLQERLAMLGKSHQPRLSRSVPASVIFTQTSIHETTGSELQQVVEGRTSLDDVDDWIGPINVQHFAVDAAPSAPRSPVATKRVAPIHNAQSRVLDTSNEPLMETNLISQGDPSIAPGEPTSLAGSNMASTPSYPKLELKHNISYTPQGSPIQRKHIEGPLSASKAKLQSMLKSARGIFTSTANPGSHIETQDKPSSPLKFATSVNTNAGTNINQGYEQQRPIIRPQNLTAAGAGTQAGKGKSEPRRSSQRLALKTVELNRSPISFQLEKVEGVPSTRAETKGQDFGQSGFEETITFLQPIPSSPLKLQPPVSHLQKPGELKRLLRPNKDAPKARPAPVSIKLASQRIGQIAPANASLGMALHDSLSQPATVRPALTKKGSTSSFVTSTSSQSVKTSSSSHAGRPKALEAAARKREQDEREAQRKAEQKREIERRRAAKAEEDRRAADEQRAVEQQRALDMKNAAQRQAIEQRKGDGVKRYEQTRKDMADTRARVMDDVVNAPAKERLQMQSSQAKIDFVPPLMQKVTTTQDTSKAFPHLNPAKPPKRQLDLDDERDETHIGQSSTLVRTAIAEELPPPKRRRTSESGAAVEVQPRPTMAPPIRPSNIHKSLQNKFAQGFLNNANPHAPQSMLKTAVAAQHNLQHPKTPHANDTGKSLNMKLAFSTTQITAGPSTMKHKQGMSQINKTPGTIHKSSPQYPNGDNIELPEIASDSEQSDDEGDFQPPDWANSPALRELLAQQQLVDPMQVFGPIAPLMMEEVFRGNKERQAKFRARTSSANWNGPDRLTEDERRRDHEARERLEKNGGWVYGAFS